MDNPVMLFLQGVVIGFALAAPVGPVGILCMRRALADGRVAAFVAGLGAAVDDTFYGAVAGFGLRLVSDFLTEHELALRVIGGSFIVLMGLQTYRTVTRLEETPKRGPGLLRDFASTLVVTLTNPGTILAFMGVFAAFGALPVDRPADSLLIVLGVFVGSSLWWLTLSGVVGSLRQRFSPKLLVWINHAAGTGLVLFGLVLLGSVAF